jgi:NitT/TauT family transport system ATP-binding protein
LSSPDPGRIMVFQDFNQLFPWKTVLENIMFPLKVNKMGDSLKDIKCKAQRYLGMVKLDGFDNYYPHQLSGGMKQKAAIARALALNPEILLMDEPFGSLDAQTRDALQEMLLKIWEDTEITILFVTHDIQEAIILSSRIIIMDGDSGNIKSIIDNTIKRPRTPLSSGFSEIWEKAYEQI